MPDQEELDAVLLKALQDSTRVQTEGVLRLGEVEEQVEHLENAFKDRMGRLESQMGTTNAHLDNIAREASITNDLLRQQHKERVEEKKRQQTLEDEERQLAREDQLASREIVKKTASELWSIFKQPLGYLVAAAIAWSAYAWFGDATIQVQVPLLPAEEAPLLEDVGE